MYYIYIICFWRVLQPLSIAHWLQHATVTEDVIIILDPDCAFVEPSLLDVEEGSPVGNQVL